MVYNSRAIQKSNLNKMSDKKPNTKERTLIILKPDAIQRGLMGEIVTRFERKGLKIVGMKFMKLNSVMLDKHYAAHKGKPFFEPTKAYMQLLPVLVMVLEGLEVARVVRAICGPTDGKNAPTGTIRGDYSMAISRNIIHSSEDVMAAKKEISIYFTPKELFSYEKADLHFFYSEEELG
jgi:nucleoside-diphosphate kinase